LKIKGALLVRKGGNIKSEKIKLKIRYILNAFGVQMSKWSQLIYWKNIII